MFSKLKSASPSPSISDLFYSIVWSSWVKLAIGKLVVAIGLSATGPFAPFIASIVTYFTDILYSIVSFLADLGTIKMKSAIHQAQFDSASENLGIISVEYGPSSPQFAAAHATEQEAFYNLIATDVNPIGVS